MSAKLRLKQTARGERPQFSEQPEVDRVMAMTMALASEVAVLRERLDTVETLASRKGMVLAEEIETFVPDAEHEARRQQWRHDFLERVLYILRAEADQAAEPDAV
jgi:hypothetical protein